MKTADFLEFYFNLHHLPFGELPPALAYQLNWEQAKMLDLLEDRINPTELILKVGQDPERVQPFVDPALWPLIELLLCHDFVIWSSRAGLIDEQFMLDKANDGHLAWLELLVPDTRLGQEMTEGLGRALRSIATATGLAFRGPEPDLNPDQATEPLEPISLRLTQPYHGLVAVSFHWQATEPSTLPFGWQQIASTITRQTGAERLHFRLEDFQTRADPEPARELLQDFMFQFHF